MQCTIRLILFSTSVLIGSNPPPLSSAMTAAMHRPYLDHLSRSGSSLCVAGRSCLCKLTRVGGGGGGGWSLSQHGDTGMYTLYSSSLSAFFLHGCSFFLRSFSSRSCPDGDLPGDFRTERGIFLFNSARNKAQDTTLQGRLRFKKGLWGSYHWYQPARPSTWIKLVSPILWYPADRLKQWIYTFYWVSAGSRFPL